MRSCMLAFVVCSACASVDAASVKVGSDTSMGLAPRTNRAPAAPVELSLKRHNDSTGWSLSDERGKVVLLDVWATWCEPCRDALPVYDALRKQFEGRGLKVYAINVDEDGSQIAKFLEEVKVGLPVLVDPGALRSESQLHVKLMPTAYLIDRKGIVREVHEGFSEADQAKTQAQIEALLGEE